MKKKFFNLAVILATLMSSAVFSSCGDDDDEEDPQQTTNNTTDDKKTDDNKKEDDKKDETPASAGSYINVVKGGTYTATNKTLNENITFTVTNVSGTAAGKNQVVVIKIDGVDEEFELSDKGASYLVSLGDGDGYLTAITAALSAGELYDGVMICLASANKKTTVDYELTSGTNNDTCKKNGASETTFAKK